MSLAFSYVQILKELTSQTTDNERTWVSIVDGNTQKIQNESQVIIPNVNTNNDPPTLFAWVQLKNKFLVPNTFSAKIISAGQEVQTLTQTGGSNNLTITQTGVSNSVVTAARIYTDGGHVEIQWNGCNTPSNDGGGGGDGSGKPCEGDPTKNKENSHRMIANYEFRKIDGDVGALSQIYINGNTPWTVPTPTSSGYGCAVIEGPKSKNSVIKSKKIIVYKNNRDIDWILEPDESTPEGKELLNLFKAIGKQTTAGFAAYLGL